VVVVALKQNIVAVADVLMVIAGILLVVRVGELGFLLQVEQVEEEVFEVVGRKEMMTILDLVALLVRVVCIVLFLVLAYFFELEVVDWD
jgi:hypothetical protein